MKLTLITETRSELGAFAEEISDWRTDRYIEAGFYDKNTLAALREAGVRIESNRPDDYEIVAVDQDGAILATLSLRRPDGISGRSIVDSGRPQFGLEKVNGTSFLSSLGDIQMDLCWEAGRFLRDRNRDSSAAVVAVTTAAAHLVATLASQGKAALIVGEVEPTVALRHLEAFGVPVIVGTAAHSPIVDGLLACRYAGRTVVPFAVDLSKIEPAALAQWEQLAARDHLLTGGNRG